MLFISQSIQSIVRSSFRNQTSVTSFECFTFWMLVLELIDLMAEEGISFRITSVSRPGARTSTGKVSHHAHGNAMDITPLAGQSWDELLSKIYGSPRVCAYPYRICHGQTCVEARIKDSVCGFVSSICNHLLIHSGLIYLRYLIKL